MITALVLILTAALVVLTLLPLWRTPAWWVRMWEFPRVHLAIGLAIAAALAFLLPGPWRWVALAAALACLAYHVWRILPYTPLWRREIKIATGTEPNDVKLLSSNVLLENERTDQLLALVKREDPDVVLFMEPDARWNAALAPVLSRYPTVLRQPQDDYYGMIFATRLQVDDARFVSLTPDETPSLFAALRDASGRRFRVIGLHPKPPVPGDDTEERDAQLLYAARFARDNDTPLVAIGDFNDVVWSYTTRRFQRVGAWRDPRIGRGFFSSFHAQRRLMRIPIDQFYVHGGVAVADFRIGPDVGSDHFPVIARIRVDPELAQRLNEPAATLADAEEADIEATVAGYAARLRDLGLGA